LPRAATISALATLAATVLGALFAGHACDCYWLGNFDRYKTISGLAMHPPMTVSHPRL
jgi:hypothetical protein